MTPLMFDAGISPSIIEILYYESRYTQDSPNMHPFQATGYHEIRIMCAEPMFRLVDLDSGGGTSRGT